MPPRKRAEAAAERTDDVQLDQTLDDTAPEQPAPVEKAAPKAKAEAPPCTECLPDGWPATATAFGCEHGNWERH
jgi:hypothetical protein